MKENVTLTIASLLSIRKRTGYTVLTEEVSLGVCGWLGRWMKRED
jgi:hypothetical protein